MYITYNSLKQEHFLNTILFNFIYYESNYIIFRFIFKEISFINFFLFINLNILQTNNVAREIGVKNLGAIALGYAADMVLMESLEEFVPPAVFYGGKLVAEDIVRTRIIKYKDFNSSKTEFQIEELSVKDGLVDISSEAA